MKKVTIRKGFFYGAGSVYGWRRLDPNLHIYGVGIDMDILKTNEVIKVRVAKQDYTLNCGEALDFIRRFQSYKWIKQKCIGVVSKSILQMI